MEIILNEKRHNSLDIESKNIKIFQYLFQRQTIR